MYLPTPTHCGDYQSVNWISQPTQPLTRPETLPYEPQCTAYCSLLFSMYCCLFIVVVHVYAY